MSKRVKITLLIFALITLLTSCSNRNALQGKYNSVFNDTFYSFSKNKTYSTNDDDSASNDIHSCVGTYNIIDGELILYIDGKDGSTIHPGVIYKEYICSLWTGSFPKTYSNITFSNELSKQLTLIYNFYENKNYEYSIKSNGKITVTETGTYAIKDNKVICTNIDNRITTFICDNDTIYCVEYIKE